VQDRLAVDGARASLASAEARVERAKTAVAEAELRLSRMTVVAPMDGFVLRRLKSPGDKVMLGMDNPSSSHIVEIYDPERLQVRADVPLAEASHVSVGQTCEVFCEVLPDRAFRGEVTRITNLADLQRNTLEVKVRILDPDPMLKPEMLTRVRFLASAEGKQASDTPQKLERFIVPREAITGSGNILVVRDRRGLRGRVMSVSVKEVDAVDGDESLLIVSGPLRETDLVVLDRGDVQQGETVQMARAGSVK
jgi:RND family efflux transporter MFP subunit